MFSKHILCKKQFWPFFRKAALYVDNAKTGPRLDHERTKIYTNNIQIIIQIS